MIFVDLREKNTYIRHRHSSSIITFIYRSSPILLSNGVKHSSYISLIGVKWVICYQGLASVVLLGDKLHLLKVH